MPEGKGVGKTIDSRGAEGGGSLVWRTEESVSPRGRAGLRSILTATDDQKRARTFCTFGTEEWDIKVKTAQWIPLHNRGGFRAR